MFGAESLQSVSVPALVELQRKLSERLQTNRQLHERLTLHDVMIEMPLVDKDLLKDNPNVDEGVLRRKLIHALEVQQYHTTRLERKVCSLEFDLKAAERERQQLQQLSSDDYKFMRTEWTHYRDCEELDLDDRIDKLSKVVAMIRGKVSRRIEKERLAVVDESERDELKQQCLTDLQSKLEKSEFQRTALEKKLLEAESAADKARTDNQALMGELKRVKDRLKAIEVQYVQVCKRQQELNERFMRNQSELKKNKIAYTGKDFVVEIYKDGLPKLEQSTLKDLQHIRDFLESPPDENRHSLQNLPSIPKLNFDKRYSVVESSTDDCELLSNEASDRIAKKVPLKEGAYLRINRSTKTDRQKLAESLSQRSFYTKLHQLESKR